jgi:opacity protein-like surface antigen
MPLLQQSSCVLAFLALSLSAVCQDKSPAITAVNREIGLSFSPSLIAYRELNSDGSVQDSEHGWILGGGFKASVPFEALRTHWLSDATYQYDDGASKHWSHSTGTDGSSEILQYRAPFVSNDIFFGIGPTFTPTSRFSLTPEADVEYREWHRGLPKATFEVIEHYTFWAPGGSVRAAYNPMKHLVLTARGGLAHTVFPTNAGIGSVAHEVPNTVFSLGTKNVWQAGFGIDYALFPRFHLFSAIDYSHFGFGRSASEPGGPMEGSQVEPNSVTDLAKVNVGFAWSY